MVIDWRHPVATGVIGGVATAVILSVGGGLVNLFTGGSLFSALGIVTVERFNQKQIDVLRHIAEQFDDVLCGRCR